MVLEIGHRFRGPRPQVEIVAVLRVTLEKVDGILMRILKVRGARSFEKRRRHVFAGVAGLASACVQRENLTCAQGRGTLISWPGGAVRTGRRRFLWPSHLILIARTYAALPGRAGMCNRKLETIGSYGRKLSRCRTSQPLLRLSWAPYRDRFWARVAPLPPA